MIRSVATTKNPLSLRLFLIICIACATTRAWPQSLPQLDVAPSVLAPDEIVTLSLPMDANLTAPQSTLVAIYERNRPGKLAESKRKWVLHNGRWSTQIKVDADPGFYELRVVSGDKKRTPISLSAELLVPGVVREAGTWLLNGSLVSIAPDAPNIDSNPSSDPLFFPELRRKANGKIDERIIRTRTALPFRVLYTGTTLRLASPGFDFAAWREHVRGLVEDARQRNVRNMLGVVVRAPMLVRPDNPAVAEAGRQMRQIVDEVAPGAALILEVPRDILLYANGATAWAAYCDAVLVRRGVTAQDGDALALKAVRRLAEEQPRYDLPIILSINDAQDEDQQSDNKELVQFPTEIASPAKLARFYMSGASSMVLPDKSTFADWTRAIERNAALFVGSVTLEDTGIWPARDVPDADEIERLYVDLLDSSRIPLLARLEQKQGKKIPEMFMSILGETISAETVEKLHIAARDGATIYLEGSPKLEGNTARWSELVGATTQSVPEKSTSMTLDDVWVFGTARGLKVDVRQTVALTLNPPREKTKKPESEKGKDVLLEPRVLSRLTDGSPALIENPVGDGRVLWLPHRMEGTGLKNQNRRAFYAALAAQMQGALVEVRSKNGHHVDGVKVALRRSPKGTWLLGLFNESDKSASVFVEANHYAQVALDLATEKELPLTVRGNRSTLETTLTPNGWRIIALGATRKELDEERFAPRAKVKLR
jgi:hypothetical protein